jgi:signal transduction histidine kinase
MKTYIYEIKSDLTKLIDTETKELINSSKSILIQLFSGEDALKIQDMLKHIMQLFPNAFVITSTTDGEIIQNRVLTHSSILSISTFENTSLKIAFCDDKESFLAGKKIAQEITTDTTKLIITFANGLLCNGEEYLEGIYSINPHTIIAGGLSADNAKFKRCYVGINGTLYDRGAVGVSLNSESLSVNNFHSFGWSSIGIKHKITKAVKNRVYTIDNITTVEFYKKYLGEDVSNELPKTGIEFPLIIDENGLKKARAAIAKHDDGSLCFAGNIAEGEYVYIGIGEVKTILSNPVENIDTVSVESFFIYSCMARRRFIPDLIYQEIEPFADIAPTSGFFTYGEFYTKERPELLNQTMTAVALSESETPNPHKYNKKQYNADNTTKALMHIINVTSKELHEQTLLQEKVSNELSAKNNTIEMIQEMSNLGSWELDLTNMKISWSKMSYKIYNMNPDDDPPSYTDFINMVVPEDRKKLIDVHKELDDAKIHSVEIRVKRNDDKILTLLESGKLIFNNGEPVKIVGTTLDITDIRMQDDILVRQSKSAQMGEMINMIAHQWRQPLNAISSAVIKLNIQSEMDLLTKEEITTTTQFIEDMTQKMSQTINDFMNFTKPDNKKELISFDAVFEDIFNIIGTQLTNHNISVDIDIQTQSSIFTYKKELEHILMNIITNARDALEELADTQKHIEIKVSTKNNLCIIKISDNAGGINNDIIDRIFDPYFTTKDSNKGTGLGLYMSKKILQEHLKGSILVRNKDDGAEFTIILDKNDE